MREAEVHAEPSRRRDEPLPPPAQRETVSFALLTMLERLSPAERAAYVLREAFAYPYDRIAEIVETTDANARQLVSRARRHIAKGRHASVRRADRDRLHDAFLEAAHDGDLEALESAVRPPRRPS